ncbi:GDP-mannose 4,6-dehydratase [Singulisphaera sp. PoT]|uniref:GDP-mannose 4,6-dehydratase n=1 Tax=Singulisphaera sp. PoT TaxID=3411797 RepID=UPI003BF4FD34
MRVLATGITGFVGGHLAEHLIEAGDEVVGLSASGRWPEELAGLSSMVPLERIDLATAGTDELAALLARTKPEVVYHLAAQSNPQRSVADPRGTWDLNLGGTFTLLEAVKASGLKPRIVLVGSGVCYGNPAPEHLPVSEACPLRPNNAYSASKGAADLLGVQHYLSHGTDVVMARPFNHAGPRQASMYVLSALARQVAEVEAGRKARVEVGNLEVVRDFTDVRDVVRAYLILAEKGQPGEIYNIGTGQGTKIADALATLTSLTHTPVDVFIDQALVRPVDQPLLIADSSKLRASTGWEPRFSIAQTLEDMLAYWRGMTARVA